MVGPTLSSCRRAVLHGRSAGSLLLIRRHSTPHQDRGSANLGVFHLGICLVRPFADCGVAVVILLAGGASDVFQRAGSSEGCAEPNRVVCCTTASAHFAVSFGVQPFWGGLKDGTAAAANGPDPWRP